MSLVLVLAMVFSFAATAFAVDTGYADDEKIQNKTAVAVMSGMGIINGKDDNKFEPTDTFKRSEAAKIITYMLLGPTKADALTTKACSFSDVSLEKWYAASIEYAHKKGIIVGFGDGTCRPEEELTRDQWLKMLLTTIGYDDEENGLVGYGWEVKAQSLAQKAGIASAAELKLDFNRDTAVLYAWNALWATKAGENKVFTVTYNDDNGKRTTKSFTSYVDALAFVNTLTTENNVVVDSKATLGDEVFDLTWTRGNDPQGRPQDEYTYVIDKKPGETDIVDAPIATFVDEVSIADMAKEIGKKIVPANISAWYVDGQDNPTTTVQAVGNNTKLAGQGIVTELYADNGKYVVVEIDYYVEKLTREDFEGTNGTVKDPAVFTLDANQDWDKDRTLDVPFGDYKAGDVIMYTVGTVRKGPDKNSACLTSVKVLNGTEGTVTNQDKYSKYVIIDQGEKTYVNAWAEKVDNPESKLTVADLTPNTHKVFYYDNNGNIIFVDDAKPVMRPVDGYALIAATDATVGAGTLFGQKEEGSAAAMSKIVDLTSGELSYVDEPVVYDEATNTWYKANKVGAPSNIPVKDCTGLKYYWCEQNASVILRPYYVNEDGEYALSDEVYDDSEVTYGQMDDPAKVTSGGNDYYATSETVLHLTTVTKDLAGHIVDAKTETVTGYKNFKPFAGYGFALTDNRPGKGDQVTDIYAVQVATLAATTRAVYVGTAEDTNYEGTAYEFTVNGTDIYRAASGIVPLEVLNTLTVGDIYDVTLNDKGEQVGVDAVPTTVANVQHVDVDFIRDGNQNVYFAREYTVCDTTEAQTGVVADPNVVVKYTVDNGKINFIVVSDKPAPVNP